MNFEDFGGNFSNYGDSNRIFNWYKSQGGTGTQRGVMESLGYYDPDTENRLERETGDNYNKFNSRNDARGLFQGLQNKLQSQGGGGGSDSNALNTYVGRGADGQGMTAAEYDLYSQSQLMTLQAGFQADRDERLGRNNLAVQQLISEAANYAADVAASSNIYSEDASTYRTTYQTDAMERLGYYKADKDSYTQQAVKTLEGEYALDLGRIQTEGSRAVAAIQGEYNLASDTIRGKTAENVEGIRSDFEKYSADRGRDAAVFGGLTSGFWS